MLCPTCGGAVRLNFNQEVIVEMFEGLRSVANVHPLFVHFPIALLLTSVVLFFAGKFINRDEFLTVAKWDLILGSLAGVVTVITGFIAASTLPHNEDIHQAMLIHLKIMVLVVLISLSLSGYLLYLKDLLAIKKNVAFLVGLILMAALLTIGADYGGKMVFKYGAGTELFQKLNPESGHNHDDDHSHSEGDH